MILLSSVYKLKDVKTNSKVIGIKPIIQDVSGISDDENNELEKAQEQLSETLEKVEVAKQEARDLIESARRQIHEDKEFWERQKQDFIQQAQQQGYQDGFESGRKDSEEQYAKLIDQAKAVVDLSKMDYKATVEQSEEVIVRLGLKVAEKILRIELQQDGQYLNIVKGVLKEVKDKPSISVYSHPDDYQIVLEHKEELTNIVNTKADLSIYPDSSLERGSCLVETPFGKIDASVDSQLQELRNKLFVLSEED